jgi:hypothetical protein
MYYCYLRNNYENLMYIYLPIAEQPIHSLAILGVGAFLGLIMGLVGVGGGFLLTLQFQVFCLTGKEVMLILKWVQYYYLEVL